MTTLPELRVLDAYARMGFLSLGSLGKNHRLCRSTGTASGDMR